VSSRVCPKSGCVAHLLAVDVFGESSIVAAQRFSVAFACSRIVYLRYRRNAVSFAPMNRFQSRTPDWRGFNVGVFTFERARAA
jgi:hypothetical protein